MSEIYSHSKISTFEKCPKKYKYRYIDKIKVLKKSIEALLGFCVHNVLEYIYNEVKTGRIPTIDEVITIYSNSWEENYNENIIIVKKDLTQKDYFNKGVKFIIDYYLQHRPFDDNTLDTEKKIEISLGELQNKKLIGYIDRLVHNIETNEYEIHDYKTANNLPSKENIEAEKQLALYSIAIKEEFGYDKEVCLIWHYLAHNKKICLKKSNEELELLKKEIIDLIDEIESATEFPTNKSILCDWCEYNDICPEFSIIKKDLNYFSKNL